MCNRKLLAVFLALSMLPVLLSGCGKPSATPPEPTPSTTQPTAMEDTYMNALHKTDPAADDTMYIMMTAASFSHYYLDELSGMMQAAGIKAKVCNLMKSSTGIQLFYDHWKKDEKVFQLIIHDENGKTVLEGMSLELAMQYYNWDVVSLQDGSTRFRKSDPMEVLEKNRQAHTELIGHFREKLPGAEVYTQQIWAYDVGFNRDGYQVDTKEEQTAFFERVRQYTKAFCEEFDLKCVYSGEAWALARQNSLVGNLCARMSINNGEGDYYHDGDIGGGQYLNACVWFETLTGQSCIGNTFRPDYALSEELIAVLQQAAHDAVAANA